MVHQLPGDGTMFFSEQADCQLSTLSGACDSCVCAGHGSVRPFPLGHGAYVRRKAVVGDERGFRGLRRTGAEGMTMMPPRHKGTTLQKKCANRSLVARDYARIARAKVGGPLA